MLCRRFLLQRRRKLVFGTLTEGLLSHPSLQTSRSRLFSQLRSLAEEQRSQSNRKVQRDAYKTASKYSVTDDDAAAIRVSHHDAPHCGIIRQLELNRPRANNAINKRLLADLSREIDSIHEESSASQTRALIIASGNNDVFCAGADLKERKTMSEQEVEDFLHSLRHVFTRLATLPVPTIACVSGAALGGGLELALCCDFRVFSESAVVGLPETRLAIIPGGGGTHRLSQAVGLSRAKDLILTGRRVTGEEAHLIGLCHRLVAGPTEEEQQQGLDQNAQAQSEALSLAKEIAGGGPVAIRAALEAVRGGSQEAENAAYKKVLKTQDRTEALAAFAGKRSPEFKGE